MSFRIEPINNVVSFDELHPPILNPDEVILNNKVTLQTHASSSAYSMKLPANMGASSQVLSTDGVSQLYWSVGGGGTAEFKDSEFAVTHPTNRKMNVDVSTISDSTTRTLIMPNADVDLTHASTMDQDVSTTSVPAFSGVVYKDAGTKSATITAPASVLTSYTLSLPTEGVPRTSYLMGEGNRLSWMNDYERASNIDLYALTTTYSISGGGTALKDSIALHGGGNVYEITDSLTYTAGIDLTNLSNIVVRGSVGQRPVIQVDNTYTSCFTINYDLVHGSTTNVTIGNLDADLSGTNAALGHNFLICNKQGSALSTDTISDIHVKDVYVYNTDYTTSTGVSRSGVVVLAQITVGTRWASNVYIEDSRFKNLTPRTDRGVILMMGVDNYCGIRNHVSSPDINTTAYSSRECVRFMSSSGSEHYTYIASGDIMQYNSDSNAVCVDIIMDQFTYSGYASPIVFTFDHCSFSNAQSSAYGAVKISYKPNEAGSPGVESEYMTITLDSCRFYSNLNAGVAVHGDGASASLRGIDLVTSNCWFEDTKAPIFKSSGYVCPFHSLIIENNTYIHCGSPLTNTSTPYKYNTGYAVASRPYIAENRTIRSATTDGYNASITMVPSYNTPNASTLTRHNYINLNNVAGNATTTNACVCAFDAIPGTHKALDASSTKTTPSAVDAWLKMNVNGVIYYVPAYTSKTS